MEVRPQALAKCIKGCCICLQDPCSSRVTPSTLRDTTTISKMGHMIIVGPPMLRVHRQNPLDGSEPPRATRVRDEATQGVATTWNLWSPIEETWYPQASYLSLDREVSFTPIFRMASSCLGFLCGLPTKEA
jgi:hypothetical protein